MVVANLLVHSMEDLHAENYVVEDYSAMMKNADSIGNDLQHLYHPFLLLLVQYHLYSY